MWEPHYCAEFERELRKFSKRHRQETLNALANLQSYLEALRSGLTPQQISRGWLRAEPKGIRAIDETGPKKPRKAIRLYVYPDEDSELLHVMTLGDKDRQGTDIAQCSHYVEQLLENKSDSKSKEDDDQNDQTNQQAAG